MCFYAKAKSLDLAYRKKMHLGIIKIIYNRTAQARCYHNTFYGRPFREPRRGGRSDFAMTIWASECITVCFVNSLSICY